MRSCPWRTRCSAGLAWIGLGRTHGPLVDETVATAAFIAAAVALLSPVITTLTARRR